MLKSKNILFVTTAPLYGAQMVLQPIWTQLSKSHTVTVITPNPTNQKNNTNLKEIDIKFIYEFIEMKYDFSQYVAKYKDEPLRYSTFLTTVLTGINNEVLKHPDVKALIKDDSLSFDLTIVEFITVPTMLAFGHRFKTPIIAITTTDASVLGQDSIGNPNHPALNPDLMLKFHGDLSFMQRVFSTLSLVSRKAVAHLVKRVEDETVSKHFGDNYPSLDELTDRIDLFLMNVNLGFHNLRPTVPAVVHFGGEMSVKPAGKLPEDIKKFLDDGKDGVVYFNLGTVIRARMIKPELLEAIFTSFARLPYRFIIKLDVPDTYPGKPDNIMIKTWLPQQDILRHENVKVFITQCGLQSIEEAIYHNVPIIGLPFFGDQYSNCLQAEEKGIGIIFDVNRLDSRKLIAAIEEVINTPTYEEKTKMISKIALDQPMTGLERATWWINHILRYKGGKHLRAPSLNVPFWKFYLLDVLAFIGFIVLSVFRVLYFLIKKCLRCCIKKSHKTKSQ
nr:UDP-glucuronosyltransferase 2B33-like isoform X2 [Onthophagus taurus]